MKHKISHPDEGFLDSLPPSIRRRFDGTCDDYLWVCGVADGVEIMIAGLGGAYNIYLSPSEAHRLAGVLSELVCNE